MRQMKSASENNLPSPINVGGHIHLSVVYTIFSESTDLTIHSSSSMRDVATSDIAHGTAGGLTG